MNTVDDLVFRVKGKTVNAPMSEIKALPEEERRKAYMRLRTLGSAVAGFTSAPAKMPPTMAMGGAGAAPRPRSPSPKPAAKPEPKPEPKPAPKKKMSAKQKRADESEYRLLQIPFEIVDDYLKAQGRDDDEDAAEVMEEIGYDEMVEEVVRRMKKEKYTLKQIVAAMKITTRDEGFTMYRDFIEEHS